MVLHSFHVPQATPNPEGLLIRDSWGGLSREGAQHAGYSLAIIITQPQLKDPLGTKLLQTLVHILAHGIEVLIGLIPKAKNLSRWEWV